jgi:hypothetical protein
MADNEGECSNKYAPQRYGSKAPPVPSLFMFIGLNYLQTERKSCPEHLNEI